MGKPENVIDKRMVNALFKQAKASAGAKTLLGGGGQVGLGLVTKMTGGLWVGGTAYLTSDALMFVINGLNAIAHTDPDSLNWDIPLQNIKDVRLRKALFTQIIDITDVSGEERSIRCYNASKFVDSIQAACAAR